METKLKIRNAEKQDIQECARILLAEFQKQGEDWTQEASEARLAELFEDNPELCFAFELDGKIIGFAFCEKFNYIKGKYLWMSEFAVSSEYQGKGYGLENLRFMEKVCKERGFDVLYLATNRNENAYKIYQKFGFEPTGYEFMEKSM